MIKKSMKTALIAVLACAASACFITASAESANAESANAESSATAAAPAKKRQMSKELVNLSNDNIIRPGRHVDYLTVLDFGASWCMPCRRLAPAIAEAAKQYAGQVEVYAIDVDANPNTAKAFNVQSVPTVVLISPDGTTETHIGLTDFMAGIPANATPDQQKKAIQDNLFRMIDSMKE